MPKSRFLYSLFIVGAFLLLILPSVNVQPSVQADELQDLENQFQQNRQQLEEVQNQKNQTQEELEAAKIKARQVQGSLNSFTLTLNEAKNKLTATLLEIDNKEKQLQTTANFIDIKEKELTRQKELLSAQVRNLYMSYQVDSLSLFLQGEDFSDSSKLVVFREAIVGNVKDKIVEVGDKLKELNEQKIALQKQQDQLQAERINLEAQKKILEQRIVNAQRDLAAAQAQQQSLSQSLAGIEEKLSNLTQQQQQILAQKAAAALSTTTVGNVEITQNTIAFPAPQDGQLHFSFWTYGYPHRVGMNQYGAYGRAKSGQNFEQILKAYYSGVEVATYPEMSSITINDSSGSRSILFEDDYLLGIGEMPSCWGSSEKGGMEALKAQAIAARTYAIAATGNGQGSICTDQRCQVYVGSSKINGECGNYWKEAVDSTRGIVILSGGQPISAWYASTAGGFTLSSREVWGTDRSYVQGISDFADSADLTTAFDGPKFGASPWYHKSWGDQPWLNVSQVQDLFNAALLPDSYNDQLAPAEKGGFSTEQILAALKENNVTSVADLKSIEVLGSATKAVSKVRAYFVDTYAEVDGSRFKFVFNLRSPGTDAIWTTRFDVVASR